MRLSEMVDALAQVTYKDWNFRLMPEGHGPQGHGPDADHLYLQVTFWAIDPTDHVMKEQAGRKWRVSYHVSKNELIQTALKAVLAAEEHEARELFTYRGKAIYGPHFDPDFLAAYCDLPWGQDARKPVGIATEEPAP